MDRKIQDRLSSLITTAPSHVHDYIVSGALEQFAEKLKSSVELSEDQYDVALQELIFLVLGAQDPRSFLENLQKSGVPSEKISVIGIRVKEELSQELKKNAKSETPAVVPTIPAASPVNVQTTLPTIPPSPINLISTTTQAQAHTAPHTLTLAPKAAPPLRTMAKDVVAIIQKPPTTPESPTPKHIAASLRPLSSTYPSIHLDEGLEVRPPPAPHVPAPQAPTAQGKVLINEKEVEAGLKQYGIDPYRESVG